MKIKNVKWWEILILFVVAMILFFPSKIIKLLTIESTQDMVLSERGKRKWWQSLIRIVASFTPLAVVVSIHDEFFPSGGGVLRSN